MKKPKLGFCDYTTSPIAIDDRMKIYKKYGIENISPQWGEEFYPAGVTRFDIYESAKRHGLNIDIAHLDKKQSNLLWRTERDGDKVVEKLIGFLQEMKDHGISVGVFHLTQSETPPSVSAVGLGRINKIIDFCEKNNLVFAIECVRPLPHFDAVLENKSPALRILFDTGHANCYYKDTFGLFQKHKTRIHYTHLSNNNGIDDEHNGLDGGTIDFEKFFALDNNIEYHLLEINPKDFQNSDLRIDLFEDFVRENWAKLTSQTEI